MFIVDVTGIASMRLLEAVRAAHVYTRIYQASSSEMFGATPPPQDEHTPFHPRSPYGAAKLYAYWGTHKYRETYDAYALNGTLYNHESPRRGGTFVTRKITLAVAGIKAGLQDKLFMGNPDAARDWGYAPEYVEGMWRMLQAPDPTDYVLATNTAYSVKDFVRLSFEHAGLDRESPSPTTSATNDPARSTPSSVTTPRPRPCSAGNPRSTPSSWSRSWSTPT